ncbi:MAG: GNAT family N-acetyltransferase [Clostridia bacterium]|nr:GNAT family N-acetyltransferase [Clostridia bacterium]
MFFRRYRVEYTDGVIDLIPVHIGAPNRELGFGHEQVWKITLHNEQQEIGQISYRDGESRCVYYYGHIGYHIDPPYRGHHFAARACKLIEREIRLSGKTSVVITCDPDNEASRKTCCRLGCLFERITEVPEDIYRKFEISQSKCRYIWHIDSADEK